MSSFTLVSSFNPKGDQPQAIEKLLDGLTNEKKYQTLLGVTGSGKTYTMANVIARCGRPTLVVSHNKTLAAQLYSEFKDFFPHNAVEYFVSYYDYYQPEAYIPQSDVYIEKDASINEDLDRLRLAATTALMSRRDVIIVASVSCIYGLGSPEDYEDMLLRLERGASFPRKAIAEKLIDIQYERNDIDFKRGVFRMRGDVIDIFPAYEQVAFRVEQFDDTIERIAQLDPVTGATTAELDRLAVYPAKHFVTTTEKIDHALESIEKELHEHLAVLSGENKLLEAQRLESRTKYDLEMLKEMGYCHGIENYSRHLSTRAPGSRPACLIDYFPEDYLLIIDESHVTVPQIRGMSAGDRARKETLVRHGFRLPSALDNRPLNFTEFESLINQAVFVSATPNEFEREKSRGAVIEQIIRPTGLLDPEIILRPTDGQIDDLIKRIGECAARKERVLVTTLTKRMSEDLAKYLEEMGLRVRYLHSEIDAIQRVQILQDLRLHKFDCLIGINLLREGLDLPEVSLVAVLDADKEGFLRSQAALIQVGGRAARHSNGKVVLYADRVSDAMRAMMNETQRRRALQMAFNKENNITPQSIEKAIKQGIELAERAREEVACAAGITVEECERDLVRAEIEREMELVARNLQFEKAAYYRDQLFALDGEEGKDKKSNIKKQKHRRKNKK